ncbi:hypothetical protein PSQ90_03120 [Devosia rhodophyticola]|uniref:Branched-chain amino acid ABC transporter permease n=1 Tax=Devosia rhodophyticola TaxID=3026423 RepID=A0ABY7YZN8_9HYPH|nr:hypothetical protein [Devosia rhodophyticola]WDR06475.1 hypothetical protein PSQ90_03120 [Devosia rhodophyticola]
MAQSRSNSLGDIVALFDEPRNRYIAFAVIIGLLIIAPATLGPYATVILTNALLYVVLALGLNVVVGYAGLLDLGYAAFLPSVPIPSAFSATRLASISG